MARNTLLLATLVSSLLACGGGKDGGAPPGGGGPPPPDTTPPTVSSTTPAAGATGVAASTTVTATFSEAVACATVNGASVTVEAGGTPVAGSVSCSGSSAVFTAGAALAAGTLHTARIGTAVTDAAGNALAAAFTWSFTTASGGGGGDTTPPAVSSTTPAAGATGVAASTTVTAAFSEPMACATLTDASFTVEAGGTPLPGSVSCSGTSAVFTPGAALTPGTLHTARVAATATDVSGNKLAAAFAWTFTTAGTAPLYTLAGRITAAAGHVADVDTADPNLSGGNNDSAAAAQELSSSATVGGWVSQAADPDDFFHAALGAGQVVTLVPGDAAPDLDLCVEQVGNPSSAVCSTNPAGQAEQIAIGASGVDAIIRVHAFGGASSYTLVLGQAPGSVPAGFTTGARFVPGEVIVRFRDTAIAAASSASLGEPAALAARAAELGLVALAGALRDRPALLGLPLDAPGRAQALATLGAKPTQPRPDLYPAPEAELRQETLALVTALRARADVQSADLNFLHEPALVPNDTHYGLQWHYPLIQLPQAWDVTTGTPASGTVEVAVIDSGVVLSHPDLAGQLLPGYDFISNPAISNDGDGIDANPNDPGDAAAGGSSTFHGTHVAGTVAARSNDAAGVAGVAWGAKVIPVRVLGKGGGTTYDILQGVRYSAGLSNDSGTVRAKPAEVINLSLGCLDCFSATAQAEYSAAVAAGSIVIAAAGNNNSPLNFYPASYDGVVSVSAVDPQLARAPYSNHNAAVDLAAPGGNTAVDRDGDGYVDGVLSTLVRQDGTTPIWEFYQGTSMAAPHVAGVVALMKAICASLTPAQLDTLISSGAITDDLGPTGKDDEFGHGLVNALKAVQAAQAQCGATPATALRVTPASLDFGNATASLTLTASKAGGGALAVASVADDAAWLTMATTAVDADGLGTYTATVDRTGLAAGSYRATITFTAGGKASVVQVSMRVGAAAPTTGDAGYLYALLLDRNFQTVGQASGRGATGTYDFQFTGVPNGSYFLVAGTDQDDDGSICDAGEACGLWPTLGTPSPLVVSSDRSGLDFTVGFGSGAGIQSTGTGPAAPDGGFRRLDRAWKKLGGAR